MNCSSKIRVEKVKLAFGHFTSKTQTSPRSSNDSLMKTSELSQDWGNESENIRVKKGRPLGHLIHIFPQTKHLDKFRIRYHNHP